MQNPFIHNFISGRIYQGNLKMVCSPGLNCYSCPASAVSCPMGSIQLFLAGVRQSISYYIVGFLVIIGAIFGRFICGFVCPMGLLQDLVYRLKTPKRKMRLRYLRYTKYAILLIFVILLPLSIRHELTELGQPWFCKIICPSGTLFGAIPLLAVNDFLRQFAGIQLIWKLTLAVSLITLSIFVYRIFCRVLCPLGAIYALMNKIAVLQMRCDTNKCISCMQCSDACHIKLEPKSNPNSPECVRCGKCINTCNPKALSYGVKSKRNLCSQNDLTLR